MSTSSLVYKNFMNKIEQPMVQFLPNNMFNFTPLKWMLGRKH